MAKIKIIQSLKICFGLFGLALSLNLPARTIMGESSTGTLLLRGRVANTTSVDWGDRAQGISPVVKFNGRSSNAKIEISGKKDSRLITIIHP